jgi:hypothetical protein
MRKYVKHRPFNFVAVALAALGFWFEFCCIRRLETMFEGGVQFGFDPHEAWLTSHQGQIGLVLLAGAVASYVWDHHRETRSL